MTNKKDLNFFLDHLSEKKTFDFMEDEHIKIILYDFLAYLLFLYYGEKENEKETELKTHTITLYLGSIIEAIVFYFVSKKLENNEKSRRKYLNVEEFKKIQKIKTSDNLYICNLERKQITLNDSINFHALINGARDNKIIDTKIIDKINKIRQIRNNIHINVYKIGEKVRFDDLKILFTETKVTIDYLEDNLK